MREFNKLVRDRIPEIIKANGETAYTRIAQDHEYWDFLKKKLIEEVDEFLEAGNHLELADVLEVIRAICDHKNVDYSELERYREEKAKKRGLFTKKIVLERTE